MKSWFVAYFDQLPSLKDGWNVLCSRSSNEKPEKEQKEGTMRKKRVFGLHPNAGPGVYSRRYKWLENLQTKSNRNLIYFDF